MPYDTTYARGRYTGVFISAVQDGTAVAPTAETVTVSAEATAGATSLSVDAITNAIKAGQTFTASGGEEFIVTADAAAGATSLSVDSIGGDEGSGLDGTIAAAETFSNTLLYRVLGTSSTNVTINENNVQQLQSVTYETTDTMSWDSSDAASKGWQVPRQGRYKVNDYAYRQVRTAALNDKEVWLEERLPDEAGDVGEVWAGRAKVRNFDIAAPADGIVDATWTFVGQGAPTVTNP